MDREIDTQIWGAFRVLDDTCTPILDAVDKKFGEVPSADDALVCQTLKLSNIVGLHPSIHEVFALSGLPTWRIGGKALEDTSLLPAHLCARPIVVAPKTKNRLEIPVYRCVSGLQSYFLALANLPPDAEIPILINKRRLDTMQWQRTALAELLWPSLAGTPSAHAVAVASCNLSRLEPPVHSNSSGPVFPFNEVQRRWVQNNQMPILHPKLAGFVKGFGLAPSPRLCLQGISSQAVSAFLRAQPILVVPKPRTKAEYLCIAGVRSFTLAKANLSAKCMLNVLVAEKQPELSQLCLWTHSELWFDEWVAARSAPLALSNNRLRRILGRLSKQFPRVTGGYR